MSGITSCARELNETLHSLLRKDERVVVLGEDIADPYGGAFKITRGLTTAFPERVRTTPVSEAAMVGLACGLALEGYRPIVEIMFGDFIGLCFDQILNHATKYGPMYAGQVSCPVIVRSPMGGGRGYGPTHSQSLEKHFLGIPHLKVVALSPFVRAETLFDCLLKQDDPALVIEHKLLYPLPPIGQSASGSPENAEPLRSLVISCANDPHGFPVVSCRAVERRDCACSIVAYGYQAYKAAELVDRLAFEEEIFIELVVPHLIAPFQHEAIAASVAQTGRLITVEEGTAGWSWGTEVAARITQSSFGALRCAPRVISSQAAIIPASKPMEQEMLVGLDAVEAAVREMCG